MTDLGEDGHPHEGLVVGAGPQCSAGTREEGEERRIGRRHCRQDFALPGDFGSATITGNA